MVAVTDPDRTSKRDNAKLDAGPRRAPATHATRRSPALGALLVVVLLGLATATSQHLRAEAGTVMLTDFSLCTPRSALATTPQRDRWQVIAYQADGVSGKMIGARGLVAPPDVTLPIQVKGWYKIYVGYWSTMIKAEQPAEMVLKLKLTGDPSWRRILQKPPGEVAEQVFPGKTSIIERFWRAEDLTGKNLTIGKFKGRYAYIAYLKLVPMHSTEIVAVKQERQRWQQTRRLVASIDETALHNFYRSVPTKDDLRDWVEVYRESSVGKIMCAVSNGDWTYYPSQFGTLVTDIKTHGTMRFNPFRHTIPMHQALLDQGIAYQDVIADHLHRMGIQFDIMIQPSIQRNPLDVVNGFFEKHLECRIRKQDGVTPINKLSFAYPQVRDFHLAILREAAQRFDVDGVNIAFVRLNRCLGWEQPVQDAFRARYGEVPQTEEKMRTVRGEFLTQFMRDARRVLDEVGRKKDKRLELSAWVWPTNSPRGKWSDVDYRAMMKEKLLDSIVVQDLMHDTTRGASGAAVEELAIAHANGCKFYAAPRTDNNYVETLLDGYTKGIDGVAEWGIGYPLFPDYDPRWKYLRVAGDPATLKKVIAAPQPRQQPLKVITIHKINGKSVLGKDLWNAVYAGG